jgi:hypothetical protein
MAGFGRSPRLLTVRAEAYLSIEAFASILRRILSANAFNAPIANFESVFRLCGQCLLDIFVSSRRATLSFLLRRNAWLNASAASLVCPSLA